MRVDHVFGVLTCRLQGVRPSITTRFACWFVPRYRHRRRQVWHWRQRRGHGRGLEPLDRECGEASGGRASCCWCTRVDAAVGHDHEDEVVEDDVGAQAAGVLGAADQFGCGAQRGSADRGEVHRVREGGLEGCGEAMVACLQLTELLDREAEASPGIRVGEPFVHDGLAGEHLVGERLGDQHLLGRKMAVDGRGADLGTSGDLPHRHVQPIGGEHRASRVEDAVAVVPGVGTQGVRQTSGHRSHFS